MTGDPLHAKPIARGAGDRGDYAERALLVQQHRPLLDVHLDIGREAPRVDALPADARGIEPGGAHRLGEGHAVGVAPLQERPVEPSDQGATREEAGLEARALLVGEGGDLDRYREALLATGELADARDGHEDAEDAVVLAAVANRVEVRPEEQRLRPRRGPPVPPHAAPDPVHP